MLSGLAIFFARHLGLHADSTWMCQMYTFMLCGNVVANSVFLRMGCSTSWRCPAWFILFLLSYHFPLFPPKKRSEAEKGESVRAELAQFIADHGIIPSQHSELASSRSLYWKLKKLKLLNLLNKDWRRAVCDDTLLFFHLHQRLPMRQNLNTAERREEDALARRWDRLLQDRAAISADVLTEFARIFAAADGEDFQSQRVVCVAVAEFYDAANVCRSDRITTVLLRDRKTL